MSAYLETSALLSWLLAEPDGPRVSAALARQSAVVTSQLTLAEGRRALRRLATAGTRPQDYLDDCALRLEGARSAWDLIPVSEDILEGVQALFPVEPLRTLDAIHVSTMLFAKARMPKLSVLSLDQRVRDNAAALGFEVLPQVVVG